MSTALESMQEPRNITPGQKRGRDEETAAGTGPDKRWPGWPGESVFRLLITSQKVGGIIGRKGEFVKKMCEETKSRIKILDGVPGIPDRVVMISAKDEPDAAISPAMDGVLKVHKRIIEGIDGMADSGRAQQGVGGSISTRMLLPGTQSGSLIGKQGSTIKSIQEGSGASVRVLGPEDVPICALPEDKVVEIQGEPGSVHKAIEQIVSHLRKFLVDRTVLPLYESNMSMAKPPQMEQNMPQQPWSHSHNSTLPSGGGGLGNNSHYTPIAPQRDSYYPPSDLPPADTRSQHGLNMYGRDPALSSHSAANPQPAPVITQVTQQMQIPLSYADAVIGTAGSNISYCRRASGAIITVQETRGVPGEMTVEIHGTATQVQTAQQLIQNFMAEASGPPADAYNTVDTGYNSYPSQSSMYTSPRQNTGHAGHSSGGYGPSSGTTGGYGPSAGHSGPTGGYGPSTGHSGPAGGYGPSAGHSGPTGGYGPNSGHSTGGYGSHYSSYRY
ncbi:hypothetical protein SUGI_0631750 [Cryptomeria japonica]|uniref:flowering locus K homology domain n=1 Tax=Cryptomeria japonica TaxID=3369 RepID=UPI002414B414|nr:flowering locus K homology domain [Cryptomeria japonica]XP_057825654.1 flowering locus K homology domain [Cryptomeria japonica]XP_057825655.1 flowering locus K homology domain [Cryptomeria japonica]XP_057825656.1 flowering locus K homology domain [Cryptomeria japonica]XP_059063384.1 flowering locus K homology domain [Cryptomeria japonica]GLJ31481.1 hypothetical protein SUGI_0631750 [Cryptomeria japonica]